MSKEKFYKKNSKRINVNNKSLSKLFESYIYKVKKKSSKYPNTQFYCQLCFCRLDNISHATLHSNTDMHNKKIEKISLSYLMKYMPNPTVNQYEAINDCIQETLSKNIFISDKESNRRKLLCEKMNSIVTENGGELKICGSLVTGLSIINASDVNLYLDIVSQNNNKISYFFLLNELATKFQQILKLKTKIKLEKNSSGLFCEDSEHVLYHISKSTYTYQLSSNLLNVYLKIDDRGKQLVQLFRYFANKSFIDKSRDGLFPPQVFTILVVFYLQHLSIPILPNLHRLTECNPDLPDRLVTTVIINDSVVRYVSDLATIKSLWTPPINTSSLAQLWIGLMRFYAIEFNSAIYMVDIRSHDPVFKSDRKFFKVQLGVDDPFDYRKNLLFSWNSFNVIDFFDDQFQNCYIYFGIPQLKTEPAYIFVNYFEVTNDTLGTYFAIPTIQKDNFSLSIVLMESEFQKLYDDNKLYYDITKWPVTFFVEICLEKILTLIFLSKQKINYLIWMLKIKTPRSYVLINNYEIFKQCVFDLATFVFNDFNAFFKVCESKTHREIDGKRAVKIVTNATEKFIKKSSNVILNFDECDEEEYDMHNIVNNEMANGETMEDDIEGTRNDESDNGNEYSDNGIETSDNEVYFSANENGKSDNAIQDDDKCINISNEATVPTNTNSESWKIPISFKEIVIRFNGFHESSNDPNTYNEDRVQALQKNRMKYNFNDCIFHKNSLKLFCTICTNNSHRTEYCDKAIPKFAELENILEEVNPIWRSKLDKILLNKYDNSLPSKKSQELSEKIFKDICNVIKSLYTDAYPQLFGSSYNGFMTLTSDIDICCEFSVDKKVKHLSRKEMQTHLQNIGRNLKKNLVGIKVSYILQAKVPIIKFYLLENIQGDISINNILAIHNTRMLKCYSSLFPKMKCLGILLKVMAKIYGIGDASQGTLSSYAYIILLIHYLQKRSFLPVLQELYEGEKKPSYLIEGWNIWYQHDTDTIDKLWKQKSNANSVSLEYLWLDFFYYYVVEFDIDKEVISIKQSTQLYKIDKEWQMYYMAIEDPFELNHNLSGSLALEKCRYILQCFAHVLKLHSCNDNLNIMEPSILRPTANDLRILNNRNKQESNSRNCSDVTDKKNAPTINKKLPILPSSFKYEESAFSKHFYIESDGPNSASHMSIPVTRFNCATNDISVLPIKLSFGDKSIIIPMLIGKDEQISTKLNNIFQNGIQQVSTLFSEISATSIGQPTTINSTNETTDINTNTKNSNQNANIQVTPQNKQIQQNNIVIHPYNRNVPRMKPNFVPNSVRMMASKMSNMYPTNFNVSPEYQYGVMRPPLEQYQNQQRNNKFTAYSSYYDFVGHNRHDKR